MADSVRITDVSPRDGLQNEAGIIPTAEKVRLVELLCKTGVDEVEVTSFVSPKWVPQLGDASDVIRAIGQRAAAEIFPFPRLGEGRGRGLGAAFERRGKPKRVRAYTRPIRDRLTVSRAKGLRKDATGPEQALWQWLRGKHLKGYKFRRQEPFGPFILDFFCASHGVAIELDGVTHLGHAAREHDERRTAYLTSHGVHVLRFSDDDAVRSTEAVALSILRHLRQLDGEGAGTPNPRPLPSQSRGKGSGRPVFSALVPNLKGMEVAAAVIREVHIPQKLSVFTAASETFCKKNTNATIAESIERFRPVMDGARETGLAVRGYISCVVACPFEGAVAPDAVARVAEQLVEIGVDEIDLGDTIGAGVPETIVRMIEAVSECIGEEWLTWEDDDDAFLTLHLHDTFGRAADCVKAALDLGVRSFDGSVAGLGGCPYASTPVRRAPGNISTETLVRTIHAQGFTTGVDLDKLEAAAAYARDMVARSRASTQERQPDGGSA